MAGLGSGLRKRWRIRRSCGPALLRLTPMLLVAPILVLAAPPAAMTVEAPSAMVRGAVKVRFKGMAKPDASGVVLYLVGFQEGPPPSTPTLVQRERAFAPAVLPITAGQSVAFPNQDSVFHNVFSPSPARPFDLGQYKQGESKTKQFPTPGVVDVYCNIHPQMAATLLVLPNRRWAVTDKAGSFEMEGVPPGSWTLFAYSRFADKPLRQNVTVAAGQTLELDIAIDELRADVPHLNKYGQPYRGEGYK